MYIAGYMVTGFLVAGGYAFGRLRGRGAATSGPRSAVPLTVAAVASPVQVLVGDWAARDVAKNQPVKLAAFEGLGTTTKGAPVHILGWYDGRAGRVRHPHPELLSLLAFHDPNAVVQGLDSVPPASARRSTWCASRSRRWSGSGRCSALLGVVDRSSRLAPPTAARVALVLPGASSPPARSSVIALIAGWVTTEVGRQPWVVYHVMRTSRGGDRRASGIPVGYARAARPSTSALGGRRRPGCCAGWPGRRSRERLATDARTMIPLPCSC